MSVTRSGRMMVAALLASTLLAACGGNDDGTPTPVAPVSMVPTADQLRSACPGLSGQTVAASAIGLASGAATVASATFVAAAAQSVSGSVTTPATPDYCRVVGTISPVDPTRS